MYLSIGHNVSIPPSQYWYCTLSIAVFFTSTLCTTLIIVNMTFGRFYSIIRPHKAASFNTVKRAKITIVCIVIFSTLYNIPHLYTSSNEEWLCLSYGKRSVMGKTYGLFYYWFSLVIQFVLPFISLLAMNTVIILTIHSSSSFRQKQRREMYSQGKGEGHNEGHDKSSKIKSSERQVYITLLLVTFGFLILTTPAYL